MCLYSVGSFVVQRFLWEAKIALSCLQHKKLLKTLKVAKKVAEHNLYRHNWHSRRKFACVTSVAMHTCLLCRASRHFDSRSWITCTSSIIRTSDLCRLILSSSSLLGWRKLEQRRVDARLALLFKIFNGLITVDARKYLRHPTRRSGTHTATASFLYLLVPPLTVFHSTLEQSHHSVEQSASVFLWEH